MGDAKALSAKAMLVSHSPPAAAPTMNSPAAPSPRVARVEFPGWPLTLLAVPILLRALIFAGALMVEPWSTSPSRIIPAWAQLLQACCFGALAFVLLRYGRHDRRAWSLGLFTLDVASTLLAPFVRGIAAPSALAWAGLHLRTDAFQAAMIWFFAGLFPRASTSPRLGAFFYAGTAAAFLLGVTLVVADAVVPLHDGSSSSPFVRIAMALQRESPGDSDWYFTLQFLAIAPLLVAMPLKLHESGPDDRRRFLWLALGIGVGLLPLAANTLLVTLWPWYADTTEPPLTSLRGAVIVTSLTAVPIAGAYAALVQRTLDVGLVLRKALQYVLARAFITGLAVAPVVALVALVAFNRERSVSDLVSGPSGMTLIALAVAACAAALGRRHLLTMLDRRFFRQQVDARATLRAVSDGVRHADSIEELRDALAEAIDRAFHPETFVTAVTSSDDCLHAIDADLPPLRCASALAQLLGGNDAALDLVGADAALLARLGDHDRGWLHASAAAVLVPLRGSTGELLGVLALGGKHSELPYSREDCDLVSAVGASGGFALDRILTMARHASHAGAQSVIDPPARECLGCGTMFGADANACPCGGRLQRSPAPLVLGDRLRFLRRVGSGGMGVVYRAMDLRLQQHRAVKTLPTTDPAMMARLRREARAMASTTHLNLATLHGLELWRGSPMLVMEFLEGGTLSDRLRRGPLSVDETVTLGTALGLGLAALHGSGLLHGDVKPSNIGFTADNTPKLLDFGLAKMAPPSGTSTTAGEDAADSTWSVTLLGEADGLRGTPAYLSPEVLEGAPASAADDLWSLAVTMLEACTGANPFRAHTVAATVARVLADSRQAAAAAASLPPPASRLFAALLGPRDARPRTALQFVRTLTEVSANGG